MNGLLQSGQRWVVFRLERQQFAFLSENVREMMAMPKARSLPQAPPHIRGMINLRGRILPVLDLRSRFGMPSFQAKADELCAMLSQREQDHRNWLARLEETASQGNKFGLTTDPHACAFGRWYDHYQTDDPWLAALLRKFDAPHKRIHAIGEQVMRRVEQADLDGARELVEGTRQRELATMIKLFHEFRTKLRESHQETAVILDDGAGACAVGVDAVESVESLTNASQQPIPALAASADRVVAALGQRRQDSGLVLILDAEQLLREMAEDRDRKAREQAAGSTVT